MAAAPEGADAWRARAARGDGARRRRAARRLALAGASPHVHRPEPEERRRARAGARPEHRDREDVAKRNERRHAGVDVAPDAGRPRARRAATRGVSAVDHAEPLVSPPWAAERISARARDADPVDLWSERG